MTFDISQVLAIQGLRIQLASGASGADLIGYASLSQSLRAAGGISVSGVEVSTDTASLVLLQGAATVANANQTQTFQWVQSSGVAVSLTATQISDMFAAAATFIQATFTALASVIAGINAGTITTTAGIDAAAWPANT